MTVFLFLALYLLLVHFLFENKNKKAETILDAIGFILVLSLRSPYNGCDLVGGDYTLSNSYYGAFSRMPLYSFADLLQGAFSSSFEICYLLYTKAISLISNDFQVFIAITSILQIMPLAFFFYKYSPNVTLSFFVFGCFDFFSFYFSGIRQSLAISIGVLAIHWLICGKTKYFVLLVLLAYTFHRTAIFMFIMLIFYKLKLPFVRAAIVSVIIIFLIPILRPLLLWISSTFFNGGYEGYLKEGAMALTMFAVYMFLLLLSYLYDKNSTTANIIRWTVLTGVFFQSFGAVNNGALTRGGYYFLICLTLLLPFTLNSIKKKAVRNMIFVIGVILLSIFFVLTVDGPRNVVPYYFFWEKPL